MTLSFEIMLVLGVIGFYMLDSLMLLYVNELIYVQANTKGQWFFICPKLRWQILGKVPCIPNPLTPSSPLFRVSWPVSSPSELQEDSESLQRFLNTLNPLRYFTILLFFLLVVGLPFVLFSFGGGFELLILIGLIYINISICSSGVAI